MPDFDFDEPRWIREKREAEMRLLRQEMVDEDERRRLQRQWEWRFPPDPGFDIKKAIENATIVCERPNFTQKTLVKESEYLVLDFIGGPKNASQEIVLRRDNRHIQDGKTFHWALPIDTAKFTAEDFEKSVPFQITHAVYKAVFIPLYETTFSEEQVVVCVFHRQE